MSDFWNCLDFLQISEVCQFSGLYVESLYFIEIWLVIRVVQKTSNSCKCPRFKPIIVCGHAALEGVTVGTNIDRGRI